MSVLIHSLPTESASLQRVFDYASEFKVLSFDIFETVVRRLGVFQPVDLFVKVGQKAGELTGLSPIAFADVRVRAEREARNRLRRLNRCEVLLPEIYYQMISQMHALGVPGLCDDSVRKLCEIEMRTEWSYLKPIPELRELYQWALSQGKTIVFVSDFYGPADFAQRVLKKYGLGQYDALFVSSEIDKSKHDGTMYHYVSQELNVAPEGILHIGDNAWADGARALQSGIAHLAVNNGARTLALYHGLDWGRPMHPKTSAMMACQSEYLFGAGLARREPSKRPVLERIGHECLGPLLLGFASWLYEEACRERFSDYYFCAREGLLLKKVFDLYQSHFGHRINSHYLEISRQVVYRSLATVKSANIDSLFVQNWFQLTPNEALRRWGLDENTFRLEITAAGFSDPNEAITIGDTVGNQRLQTLFKLCRSELTSQCARIANNFRRYLEQTGLLTCKSPCLVDSGWHGSLQRGLITLFGEGNTFKLAGRYLGLFLVDAACLSLPASGYLCSTDGTPRSKALRAGPSLVELLHTASHGSTYDFTEEEEQMKALYGAHPDETSQYKKIIDPIQSAGLAFVEEILGDFDRDHEEVSPEYAFSGLNRLLNHPSQDELCTLGNLRIATNYGETAPTTRLTDLTTEGYRLWRSG